MGQLLGLAGVTYIDRLLPEGRAFKNKASLDPAVMDPGLHMMYTSAEFPIQLVEIRHGRMGKLGEVMSTAL